MKEVWAGSLSLAAVALMIAEIVSAGPGPGLGYCNGCGMGRGMGSGAGRIYDPAKAETVSGQVVSVERFAARRGAGSGVILKVSSGSGTLAVHLGPKWFQDKQEMKFAAGDAAEIKGVKAVLRGQDIFIAAE